MIRHRDRLILWFAMNPDGEQSAADFERRFNESKASIAEALGTMVSDNLLETRKTTTAPVRTMYRPTRLLLSMLLRYRECKTLPLGT